MVMTAFSLALAIVGASLFVFSSVQWWRARQSLAWPLCQAEVIETRVDQRRHRGIVYEPIVRYRYRLDGRPYEGKRIIFSGLSVTTRSEEEAENFIGRFEVGASIPIRVSPSNPRLAVIEPGIDHRRFFMAIAFAVAFIAGGLSGVLRG